MSTTIEIDGKKLLPVKDVISEVSYSHDYITRLAREQKIIASNVGRQWFVDLDSLLNYKETAALEQEIRKKQLSEERLSEQKLHEAIEVRKKKNKQKARYVPVKAVFASFVVGAFGLVGGWSAYDFLGLSTTTNIFLSSNSSTPAIEVNSNLASVSKTEQLSGLVEEPVTFTIDPISENVSEGVLLLPDGSMSATVTDLFSDEVQILTNEDGVKVVVRVDEYGVPVGNVIPFVKVPINNKDG